MPWFEFIYLRVWCRCYSEPATIAESAWYSSRCAKFCFVCAVARFHFHVSAPGIAPQVVVEWCVEHRRAAHSTPVVQQARRPREAIAELAREAAAGGPNFVRQQNVGILSESAVASLRTVESALRCWAAFAEGVLGVGASHLPPTTAGLVLFSGICRNLQTYANYVSAIRMACQVAGLSTQSLYGTEMRRAQQAIARRTLPQDPKEFIQAPLLRKLCRLASQEGSSLFVSCFCRFQRTSQVISAVPLFTPFATASFSERGPRRFQSFWARRSNCVNHSVRSNEQ